MINAWLTFLEVGLMVLPFIILTIWVVMDYINGKHK